MRIKSPWGSSRATRFALFLLSRRLAVHFLVGLSIVFDGAEVVDLNFIIGRGLAEDEFDSSYLDNDGVAVFF